MIESFDVNVKDSDSFSALWQFQFASGGRLDLDVQLAQSDQLMQPNNTIQILLMSKQEIQPLQKATLEGVCAKPNFSFAPTIWQVPLGGGVLFSASFEHNWNTSEVVYLLQLNCHRVAGKVSVNLIAVNPGGEYLSLEEVPFEYLFKYTGLVWTILLILWSASLIPYRVFNIRLQLLYCLIPFFEVLVALLSYQLWMTRSRTGYDHRGWYWTSSLTSGLSKGVFFAQMLASSKGFGFLKHTLDRIERIEVLAYSVAVLVSYWLYHYLGGMLLFLLVIIYSSALRLIFKCVLENCQLLVDQLRILERANYETKDTPVRFSSSSWISFCLGFCEAQHAQEIPSFNCCICLFGLTASSLGNNHVPGVLMASRTIESDNSASFVRFRCVFYCSVV